MSDKDPMIAVPLSALRWWAELTSINPADLTPRIQAYIDGAAEFKKAQQEGTVTIKLPPEIAQNIGEGLSDLICWNNGFVAAVGEDSRHAPMGVEAVRQMRMRLMSAMRPSTAPEADLPW